MRNTDTFVLDLFFSSPPGRVYGQIYQVGRPPGRLIGGVWGGGSPPGKHPRLGLHNDYRCIQQDRSWQCAWQCQPRQSIITDVGTVVACMRSILLLQKEQMQGSWWSTPCITCKKIQMGRRDLRSKNNSENVKGELFTKTSEPKNIN